MEYLRGIFSHTFFEFRVIFTSLFYSILLQMKISGSIQREIFLTF